MSEPPVDGQAEWDGVIDAVRQSFRDPEATGYAGGTANMFEEWTWLDEPLPAGVEAAVQDLAATRNWHFDQTRAHARRIYYLECRQKTNDYSMLHTGSKMLYPYRPMPIESLPEQFGLTFHQLGYLHAHGQLIGDQREINEDDKYPWQGILGYGGWLRADPRHLEGPIPELELRVGEVVSELWDDLMTEFVIEHGHTNDAGSVHRKMPEREAAARRAAYHAFWYRLNVRLERLKIARLRSQFLPSAAKPQHQVYGVSHEGAERLCAEWLAHLGATNVSTTQLSGDGGVDIISDAVIAQVKNYSGTVGVEEIRAFYGAASVDGRFPVFFTSGKYSLGAIEFADQAQMPLLVYNAVAGTLDGANRLGIALTLGGFDHR